MMFAIVVTMLLSDKELGGSNWLAAAADPRPDQLPTPVRPPFAAAQSQPSSRFALEPHFGSLGFLPLVASA